MIMTTGRISTDMVLKAVNIGCPAIVSKNVSATLALEVAKELGITVTENVISSKPIICTYKDKIVNEESYMDENLLIIK
jgi:FdhD protein